MNDCAKQQPNHIKIMSLFPLGLIKANRKFVTWQTFTEFLKAFHFGTVLAGNARMRFMSGKCEGGDD